MSGKTKKLTVLAVFCAMAIASLFLIKFKASFLTFDLKDTFLLISALVTGPVEGIAVSFVAALVEMLLLSETGIYGFIMNFVSSALFCFIASLIYRRKRTAGGAVIALIAASLCSTAVMLLLNLVITPLYTKSSVGDVIALIPPLLLPFNLIKYFVNSAAAMLLYKPLTAAIKKTKLLDGEIKYDVKTSAAVTVITLIIIAVCIFSLFYFLNGAFGIYK